MKASLYLCVWLLCYLRTVTLQGGGASVPGHPEWTGVKGQGHSHQTRNQPDAAQSTRLASCPPGCLVWPGSLFEGAAVR